MSSYYPVTEMFQPSNIELVPMTQRLNIKNRKEDWTGKSDTALRRKLQNRLNQRASRSYTPILNFPNPSDQVPAYLKDAWVDASNSVDLPLAEPITDNFKVCEGSKQRMAQRPQTTRKLFQTNAYFLRMTLSPHATILL